MRREVVMSAGVMLGSLMGVCTLRSLEMYRRLPSASHVAVDGVTTIADAVAACQRTGFRDWELVAYAQRLVARKFTYSRLNTWDSPARAFERGRGYCEQQALALNTILHALGVRTRPVFALRCRFRGKLVDGVWWPGGMSGHAWLRVRIGEEERDVCPGSIENIPGKTHFQVLSPVLTWSPWLRPFTHVGSAMENIRRDWLAQRQTRQGSGQGSAPRILAAVTGGQR